MSPRFVLGRENVPCVAEVVSRSLKADCTDFNIHLYLEHSQDRKIVIETVQIIEQILSVSHVHGTKNW